MKVLVTGCEEGLGKELRKQLVTGDCQLGLILSREEIFKGY